MHVEPVGPGRSLGHEQGVEDEEAAIGDDPPDAPGALSLPLLWAETAMELEQHDRVVEKLAGPAAPDQRQPALSHLLAMAHIELRQFDDAAVLLKKCPKTFPGEPVFPQLMAQVQVSLNDPEEAIETLERAIAPSCAGGGCRAPALHLPSARMLASLHLDQGSGTDRAREILELIQGSRRGRLEWADLALLARCERQDGDESACTRLLQQARTLAPPDAKEIHAQLDALGAAKG